MHLYRHGMLVVLCTGVDPYQPFLVDSLLYLFSGYTFSGVCHFFNIFTITLNV